MVKTNDEWYNKKVRKAAELVIYKVYEFRLINDIWVSTMGIFLIFTSLNYMGLGFNFSSLLSFIIGVCSIITPIIIFKIVRKYKDN